LTVIPLFSGSQVSDGRSSGDCRSAARGRRLGLPRRVGRQAAGSLQLPPTAGDNDALFQRRATGSTGPSIAWIRRRRPSLARPRTDPLAVAGGEPRGRLGDGWRTTVVHRVESGGGGRRSRSLLSAHCRHRGCPSPARREAAALCPHRRRWTSTLTRPPGASPPRWTSRTRFDSWFHILRYHSVKFLW
ncbi:Os06g0566801, partial [Oryza sativa Japonica Group]